MSERDADGGAVWTLQFGNGGIDVAYGVATCAEKSVLVAGSIYCDREDSNARESDACYLGPQPRPPWVYLVRGPVRRSPRSHLRGS